NMRNTLIFLTVLSFVFSCKKEDDDSSSGTAPATQNSSSSFSAYVDGILTTADSATGYIRINSSLGIPIRIFMIMGYCPGKEIIPDFGDTVNSTTLTTLSFDSAEAGAGIDYFPLNDTINEFNYTAATFKITSVDTVNKKVSGEFSGTVVGDVS